METWGGCGDERRVWERCHSLEAGEGVGERGSNKSMGECGSKRRLWERRDSVGAGEGMWEQGENAIAAATLTAFF